MRLSCLAGAALAAIALVSTATAGEEARIAGVVELFTSQGCNSCPPADAVLADLAQQPDILALGYHVDYWDYLGWRDTMASPENTARQHDYRRTFGSRSVYTPQAVVNGKAHMNGAKRHKVERALQADRAAGLPVAVEVTRRGESVVISAGPGPGGRQNAHLLLVFFGDTGAVDIGSGENGGRRIIYWNPVTSMQTVGMWHGASARFELPASEIERKGKGGCAVLLQSVRHDGAPAAILGAAVIGKPATN